VDEISVHDEVKVEVSFVFSLRPLSQSLVETQDVAVVDVEGGGFAFGVALDPGMDVGEYEDVDSLEGEGGVGGFVGGRGWGGTDGGTDGGIGDGGIEIGGVE